MIERGLDYDLTEPVRFNGEPRITTALKNDIKFLPDFIMEDVCGFFQPKKGGISMLHTQTVWKGQLDLIRKVMANNKNHHTNIK